VVGRVWFVVGTLVLGFTVDFFLMEKNYIFWVFQGFLGQVGVWIGLAVEFLDEI
jgi:hypothetical protein